MLLDHRSERALSTLTAVGLVAIALLACKAGKSGVESTSASAAPSAAPSAAATTSVAAIPSPSVPPKQPSKKQPPPKGCPAGWTRTTKGICVDWCEVDDDCDETKTCQDSPHVDPDLGKIKTCQAPKPAASGSPSAASTGFDPTAPHGNRCPPGEAVVLGGASGHMEVCMKRCKTDSDCPGDARPCAIKPPPDPDGDGILVCNQTSGDIPR